ncbi:MAG: HNH endonuclease [Verrucomicrobiales bacterium]|nr:MAG: HNH endonuclease [Verrucomicrobiales bacterium]
MKKYSLQEQIDSFWSRVKKTDDCWIFSGGKKGRGYGQHRFQGQSQSAHRVSFQLCKGEIPKGILVCHTCDNPPCVNPDHLFLGTGKDNAQDMLKKGRENKEKGSKRYCSKLTEETCLQLKRLLPSMTDVQLSKRFGISRMAVWFIRNGLRWMHVVL